MIDNDRPKSIPLNMPKYRKYWYKLTTQRIFCLFNQNANKTVDFQRRQFLLTSTKLLASIAAGFAFVPFISSWLPSYRLKRSPTNIEIDLRTLAAGQKKSVIWCGKPVWIIHRTPEMLAQLLQPNLKLRDPDSLVNQQPANAKNVYRSVNPAYLVVVAICTHLSCIPAYKPDGDLLMGNHLPGFYCPCHGSYFDLAGRVVKGVPAPINLEIPPYHFINDHLIVIGEQ